MARDPYRYYRIEARELCQTLARGLVHLGEGSGDARREVCARLLRVAHTLKGAARVVKHPAVAELAHAFEEELGPHREGEGVEPLKIGGLLELVDAIGGEIAEVAGGEASSTVRVEIGELDELVAGATEAAAGLTALEHTLEGLGAVRRAVTGPAALLLDRLDRELRLGLGRSRTGLESVLERAGTLRLAPAGTVFAVLESAVGDAGAELGKRVELVASGGEHRLDRHVLAPLKDALIHVVRNAVAHGIESEVERAAAGKPEVGRIELAVERRGPRLAFVCRDDGRGIDVAAVGAAAVRAGRIAAGEAAALDVEGAVRLLLAGGLSTQTKVSEIAGRGIGLDAARAVVDGLAGEIHVRSEPGRGSAVELCVPLSPASIVRGRVR